MTGLVAVMLPLGRGPASSLLGLVLSEVLLAATLVGLWRRWMSALTVMRWASVGAVALMTVAVQREAAAAAAGGDPALGMRLVAYGTIVSGLAMLLLGPLRGAVASLATQLLWVALVLTAPPAAAEAAAASELWRVVRYNLVILTLLWGVLRTNAMLRAERDRLRAAARREQLRAVQRQQHDVAAARDLAEAAHELRAPLSTIAVGTETLATWGDDLDEHVRGQVVDSLRHASARLDQRTTEFLAAASDPDATGLVHREQVDVAAIVAVTLQDLELLTAAHDVVLDAGGPTEAWLDPDGLDHIVTNLVHNATKYVPGGGRIDVRIHREADTTVVVVADDGPGVPPEERQHLFDPYVRARDADAEAEGSGVGLAVVRSWVRRHDGQVRLLDTRVGAAFEVRLPDGPRE